MNVQITKQKLLIVEGRDEENFFTAALAHHAIADVQILAIGGKTNLGQNLKGLLRDAAFPAVQCLAIVRDADLPAAGSQVTAAAAAFNAVRNLREDKVLLLYFRTIPRWFWCESSAFCA